MKKKPNYKDWSVEKLIKHCEWQDNIISQLVYLNFQHMVLAAKYIIGEKRMDDFVDRTIKSELATRVAWYTKHRTKIWGTIWFIAGLLGGNTDRLYSELSKPLSSDNKIEAIEADLHRLENRVLQLEMGENSQKMPLWSGSITL